jgi:cell division protease FtsH
MKVDKAILAKKKQKLEEAKKQLKSEFFGLDDIIDKVVDSVYSWYVFPELIKRPVIVNLWGMTGVGKTQLVRRLAHLLDFSNKFVEIQMDGTSGGSGYRKDSISSILSTCIDEGEPGILLLDEIQRFRTVDDNGADVKVERFQDVWMLLSDGKFSANSELFSELEMMIAYNEWKRDGKESEEEESPQEGEGKAKKSTPRKEREFKLYPYEAKSLKKLLRLSEPIAEIMKWDSMKIEMLIREVKATRVSWEIDYSKLIIFVSGNLDSAFTGSMNTEDCDTDADFYHEVTKKITSPIIKESLKLRFKPEQISRLGNNHIIYPSMNKESYQKLIKATCNRYIAEMSSATDIEFSLDPLALELIYQNSVYPTQGTRPVFSSIHKIFSTALVNVACWCLESNIHSVNLEINAANQKLYASDNRSNLKFETDIELEISNRKAKTTEDFKTMVAVHEAGHAIVYALLTKSAPLETKINNVSFSKGYMLGNEVGEIDSIVTKAGIRNKIAILLSGTIAEEIVFGNDQRSSGCSHDISVATTMANQYVRRLAFSRNLSKQDTEFVSSIQWSTRLSESNEEIEQLLQNEFKRAKTLITENIEFYKKIVDALLINNTIDQDLFIEIASEFMPLKKSAEVFGFSNKYNFFRNTRTE